MPALLVPGLPQKTNKTKAFKMLTIQEITSKHADETKPFPKPIRVDVIKCSGKTNYKNAKQENKVLYHLALADATGTIKAICYQENLYTELKKTVDCLFAILLSRTNQYL